MEEYSTWFVQIGQNSRDISPLVADKVVIWSVSEEYKRGMEEMGLCTILEVGKVRFERCNP